MANRTSARTYVMRGPGPCAIEGCEKARRKRGWCDSHYSRWFRNGSALDADQRWTISDYTNCACCGDPISPEGEFRRYCSRSCASEMSVSGPRPPSRDCALCGAAIDLLARHPGSGRRMYSSRSTCDDCRKPSHLIKWIVAIVERDGDSCHLCSEPVDLALRHPDPASRSVDHIIPRSRGGADRLDNYALSHLICNLRKSNRLN